jgi:hypothetical protein
MTQLQYQRQLRLRNQEQLCAVYGIKDIPQAPYGYYPEDNSVVSY